MKLTEAITKLNIQLAAINHPGSYDHQDALTLAITCLEWRLKVKTTWAFSKYHRLPGEDEE